MAAKRNLSAACRGRLRKREEGVLVVIDVGSMSCHARANLRL